MADKQSIFDSSHTQIICTLPHAPLHPTTNRPSSHATAKADHSYPRSLNAARFDYHARDASPRRRLGHGHGRTDNRGGRRPPTAVPRRDSRPRRHRAELSYWTRAGATFGASVDTIGIKAGGTHTSVDSLLAGGKPDMAIVTMIAAHAPDVIRPLLEAGVHVMAEKPGCVNVGQFEELASLADANGAHLMLALSNRNSPSVADARRIIQNNGIGDLYAVRAVQVDDQTRIQRRLDDPDWTFQKKLAGGGHLSWLGIHRLDMLSYLVGEDIVEVSGNDRGGRRCARSTWKTWPSSRSSSPAAQLGCCSAAT